MDCAACGFSGHAITGDLNMIDNLMMKTDARYIIVVEKVNVFQGCDLMPESLLWFNKVDFV